MPYIRKAKIIGPSEPVVEYVPPDPREKSRLRDEYPDAFVLEQRRQNDIAEAGVQAAEERGETQEAIIDVEDVLTMRKEQERIWGPLAEYYQSFGKP